MDDIKTVASAAVSPLGSEKKRRWEAWGKDEFRNVFKRTDSVERCWELKYVI